MSTKIALLIALPILLGTGSAAAQDITGAESSAATHKGFWLSAGGGGGWSGDLRGAAVYLRMGGTPSANVLFGGEVITWFRGDQDYLQRINVTATALFYPLYPSTGGGLFLKGGFGVATTGDGGATGVGTTFGAGYDFGLGGNLYVTPNIDFLVQFFESWTDTQLVITLGLGFH
jgi:hypothetical protein